MEPRLSDKRPKKQATSKRARLGAEGESKVLDWYQEKGYELVARNWRCRTGEIDLIVSRRQTLVFCEVKTRTSSAFGGPFAAVGETKQARLRSLALEWLAANPAPQRRQLRFDVAGVLAGEVEVIENAF